MTAVELIEQEISKLGWELRIDDEFPPFYRAEQGPYSRPWYPSAQDVLDDLRNVTKPTTHRQ